MSLFGFDNTTPYSGGLHDAWGSETVTIYVGKEQKKSTVHKKLLSVKSPYFDTMFNGAFREGVTQTATDDQTTIEAFDLFTSWLYKNTVPGFRFDTVRSTIGHVSQESDDKVMVDFYILADRYLLPESLKTQLVTAVANRGRGGGPFGSPPTERYDHMLDSIVSDTIKGLPEDDAMRKGVISRACKAIITDTDIASQGRWLVAYTSGMDADTLRQFVKTYHELASEKIREMSEKPSENDQDQEQGTKRKRTDDKASTPSNGFSFAQASASSPSLVRGAPTVRGNLARTPASASQTTARTTKKTA